MAQTTSTNGFVALSGATGLIGHYVLAELLRRGCRCMALVRHASTATERLEGLLMPLGIDAKACTANERLIIIESELLGAMENAPGLAIHQVIHAAGCTRFHLDSAGDPMRTNIEGTAAILKWAALHNISSMHLISTAYICGRSQGTQPETMRTVPPEFNNTYEQSKWHSERMCAAWARAVEGRRLTVHRPSIVVGDRASGRTTSFSGFYLSVRAAEVASRLAQRGAPAPPATIKLRAPGHETDEQNIVPVDYVAAMIAGIVTDHRLHGRVYHIVHPSPPTNALIQQAVGSHFNIRITSSLNSDTDALIKRNGYERAFDRLIDPIRPYFTGSPQFDRTNAAQAEQQLGLHCEPCSQGFIERLCAFATLNHPEAAGTKTESRALNAEDPSAFFERFLPRMLPRSNVARMAALSATVRFVIVDIREGQWACRFEHGRLTQLHRGMNGVREDFGYRLDQQTFWQAVRGELDPQQAFLNRRAEVFGDVEQALKMAMVLNMFSREFPYRIDDNAVQSKETPDD